MNEITRNKLSRSITIIGLIIALLPFLGLFGKEYDLSYIVGSGTSPTASIAIASMLIIMNIQSARFKLYLTIIALLLFVSVIAFDFHLYMDSLTPYKLTSERTINSIIVLFLVIVLANLNIGNTIYGREIFYIIVLYAILYFLLNIVSFTAPTLYKGFSAYTASLLLLVLLIKIVNTDSIEHIFSLQRVVMCVLTIGSIVAITGFASEKEYDSWIDMAFDISLISAIFNTILVLLFAMYNKKYNMIYTLVTQDSLTGAFSRSAVYDIINRYRSVGHRSIAVMFIDADHFKKINDTYGHQIGDRVLINLVKIMKSAVRDTDSVIRWGGEEFVILCPMNNEDDLLVLSEKIRLSVEEDVSDLPDITVSVGSALGMIDDIYDTIDNADKAVYASKDSGRNKVTIADSMFKKFNLTDFHKEFDEDRVVFYGQPVLHGPTGSYLLIEFLMRIKMNDDIIPPSKFIHRFNTATTKDPLLFKKFLDTLFDAFALANSKLLISKYSFNVHIDVLRDIDNVNALLEFNDRFKQLKITPILEILEYESSEEDAIDVTDHATILRSAGMLLALDDFGVKDSNLLRLLTFRVDFVKLDMNFVQELTRFDEEKAHKVIRTVATLIGNLNPSKIIAEGVETIYQAGLLADNLISNHQGYLYSKPGPIEDINRYHMSIAKS